jgi:hypothetical protein
VVQLSALCNGEDEHGGDRVGVDCPTKGNEQNIGKGASVNPTLRKVREGWGTRQCCAGEKALMQERLATRQSTYNLEQRING